MSNAKVLRRRLKSVQNTRQITKAMELVAASKLRKTQVAAINARAYTEVAYSILHRVTKNSEVSKHPYFSTDSKARKKLYILFASDRGLAGSFLSSMQHKLSEQLKINEQQSISSEIVVFGKRAAHYFAGIKNVQLSAVYSNIADIPDDDVFAPIVKRINDGMNSGELLEVVLVFTEFITALHEEVRIQSILPIVPTQNVEEKLKVYDFEPDSDEVLTAAAKLYIQSQITQAKIDSAASEYAMKMMAMNSASRNAGELIDLFRLELNATRQAAITQEIAEISGGMAALTGA